MSFLKTNSVDIVVGDQIYNSLQDLGLAIQNTDYIGSPVQDESNLVWVAGRSAPLDLSDSVFGGTVFSYRPITIIFGGFEDTADWDNTISRIRNIFEGKTVKLYFYTEQDWYWTGKVRIEEFQHKRQVGTFKFMIPYADAYKYRDHVISVTSTADGITVYAENCRKKVYPVITNTAAITVQMDGTSVALSAGTHKNTALYFDSCMNEMTITGAADVTISYTEGSL